VQKRFLKVADSTLTDFDFEEAEPTFFNAEGPDDANPQMALEGWKHTPTQDRSHFVVHVKCIVQRFWFIVYVGFTMLSHFNGNSSKCRFGNGTQFRDVHAMPLRGRGLCRRLVPCSRRLVPCS
jgi:hypothetical protein